MSQVLTQARRVLGNPETSALAVVPVNNDGTLQGSNAIWTVTHAGVAAGSTVEFAVPAGFNALLVKHEISGATPNGFVSLAVKHGTGVGGDPAVAHHGRGNNIKTANVAVSYVAVFEGVGTVVNVVLNWTAGTHTVRVLPIRI